MILLYLLWWVTWCYGVGMFFISIYRKIRQWWTRENDKLNRLVEEARNDDTPLR